MILKFCGYKDKKTKHWSDIVNIVIKAHININFPLVAEYDKKIDK